MDIKTLMARYQRALADAEARASDARTELSALIDGKEELTPEEDKRAKSELIPRLRDANAAVDAAKADLADVTAVAADEARIDAGQRDTRPTDAAPAARGTADVHIGREPRVYSAETDPRGTEFIRDVAANFLYRDAGAAERLTRHMQEERVERGKKLAGYEERAAGTGGNANTTNFGAIVVPQYLIDMTAPAVANMRPFADICNNHPLPAEGLSVTIPKITTATSAADQATELASVSATSLAETDLTFSVRTAAGQQTLSRQAIDRGRGAEDIVVQDLVKRYASNLDSQLLNLATVGLDAVATAAKTYTGAPTLADFYSAQEGGAAGIEAVLLGQAMPSHLVMHSRRWHWLASLLSSTWPVINGNLPTQETGEQKVGVGYGSAVRGQLPNGLKVVVDNNISTAFTDGAVSNADHAYVVPNEECHLWEDPNAPAFIRAEQPAAASLGVLLVMYGYYAFTFQRYPAGMIQSIKGLPVVVF